jgi:antitoxin HicB
MGRESALARYRVILERNEDGAFVVEAPSLPGCVSQGRTREEAMANIRDAIAGYVTSLQAHREPMPPGTEEEFVEVP